MHVAIVFALTTAAVGVIQANHCCRRIWPHDGVQVDSRAVLLASVGDLQALDICEVPVDAVEIRS